MAHETPPQWDRSMRQRLRRGEAAALGELYDRFAPLAYGVAHRLVDDEDTAGEITRDSQGVSGPAIIHAFRLLDSQPVEEALVAAPTLSDPNLEVEEDPGAQLALELAASRGADLAHHAPALADQDPLLGLALRPHPGPDHEQAVFALLELVDLDLHRVRQLLAGAEKHLLPDGHLLVLL
jgi:hypothetical protein